MAFYKRRTAAEWRPWPRLIRCWTLFHGRRYPMSYVTAANDNDGRND